MIPIDEEKVANFLDGIDRSMPKFFHVVIANKNFDRGVWDKEMLRDAIEGIYEIYDKQVVK